MSNVEPPPPPPNEVIWRLKGRKASALGAGRKCAQLK